MNQLLTRSWDYHKKLTSHMDKSSDHVYYHRFFNNIYLGGNSQEIFE